MRAEKGAAPPTLALLLAALLAPALASPRAPRAAPAAPSPPATAQSGAARPPAAAAGAGDAFAQQALESGEAPARVTGASDGPADSSLQRAPRGHEATGGAATSAARHRKDVPATDGAGRNGVSKAATGDAGFSVERSATKNVSGGSPKVDPTLRIVSPTTTARPLDHADELDYLDAEAEAGGGEAAEGAGGGGGAAGAATALLEAAGARLQRLLGAAQEAAEALAEVPRQLWLLPIRLGFYPGLTRQQDAIPRLAAFPCAKAARSARGRDIPTSVHRLRPSDVRVVAALGDSLTAANGALAYTEEETRLNYRGVSAYAGGQGTWREYLTVPNILKEFNPKLQGYAVGIAEAGDPRAGLNVARNGALDDEMAAQARRLVRALHDHPYVDAERDWKVVNLLAGGNDLCNEYCYSEGGRHSAEGHGRALRAALDVLQRHLPRTLVNLVHVPNLLQLRSMRNVPFACHLKQLVLCSCLFGGAERAKAESVGRMLRGYWQAEREIAEDPRYDSDNFTVALQPFFLGVEFPDAVSTWFGEAPDLSFFAPDCFHFSQKGNALAANALWNNLLEPDGRKSLGWQPLMQRFLCPNESAPYFFTRRNSQTFLRTGRQDGESPAPAPDPRSAFAAPAAAAAA